MGLGGTCKATHSLSSLVRNFTSNKVPACEVAHEHFYLPTMSQHLSLAKALLGCFWLRAVHEGLHQPLLLAVPL